jgi:predicted AlkP superfamily pyrophosphatase or phosphodiesterase
MRNGWDFFHGRVRLGRVNWNMLWGWSKAINGPLDFILFGYEDRQLPATDGDILDFWDTIDYVCTLRYCRMLSFQMLNNDRALYQQWLASTNNTDVSPTQLQGMLNQAQNEVDRQRKRNLLIRRTVVHGPQYI